MQGSSRQAQRAAQEHLESVLGAAGTDGAAVGDALFAVVDLLDSNSSLRRGLTDPSRTGEAKVDLIRRLLDGKVSADVLDLLAEMARSRWSRGRDLPDAIEQLGASSVLAAAETSGRADRVEDELFRFERLVDANPELARALADRAAPASSKSAMLDALLADKVAPETLILLRRAVLTARGMSLEAALEEYGRVAAARREQLLAHVTVALPLEPAQRDRLVAALSELYGKSVHLNVDIDPQVLGGIRVEIGDEVLDGTVARRLDDVRQRLSH